MPLNIKVANKVGVKVEGSLDDEQGNPQPFAFRLTCQRKSQDELAALLKVTNTQPMAEFIESIAEGWAGVRDEAGSEIPFSQSGLRELCAIPGMSHAIFVAYVADVGVKAKN